MKPIKFSEANQRLNQIAIEKGYMKTDCIHDKECAKEFGSPILNKFCNGCAGYEFKYD